MRTAVAVALALALAGCDEGPTEPGPPMHLLGDITGDGVVNIIDAQQLVRWVQVGEAGFPIGEPVACVR